MSIPARQTRHLYPNPNPIRAFVLAWQAGSEVCPAVQGALPVFPGRLLSIPRTPTAAGKSLRELNKKKGGKLAGAGRLTPGKGPSPSSSPVPVPEALSCLWDFEFTIESSVVGGCRSPHSMALKSFLSRVPYMQL